MAGAERHLLALLGDLLGLLDVGELNQGVLDGFPRVLPCEWISLNEVGPDRVTSTVVPPLDPRWLSVWTEHAHENPLYRRWLRTRDGRAYRFSDVVGRAELEELSLYRTLYGPLGIRHQMAFSLQTSTDRIFAVALSRTESDFTDAERSFCNRARPFLIQLYRNAVAHSQLYRESVAALAPALAAHGLTTREAEVLALSAVGSSSRDVAADLGVSDRTIQKHLERGFRKLGVNSRSAAAERAWELARSNHADVGVGFGEQE